ncbi:MAG: transposase [Planctomycetes bacterium]|nr:transposase [Planctomycetota bacterium]
MDYTGVLAHCICSFHGQWIPGDERSWRSRNHKSHSSGDYNNPPPDDEHKGLRHHVRQSMKKLPVVLRIEQQPIVGEAFICKLQKMNCELLILSCSATHVHALCKLTESDAIKQIGKAKQFASLRLKDHTGQLWGERSKVISIRNESHLQNTFQYIQDHAMKENAWIWRQPSRT